MRRNDRLDMMLDLTSMTIIENSVFGNILLDAVLSPTDKYDKLPQI